ncbi:hypothetical protein HZS_3153, partial [Henneguya salminicola]
MNQNRKSTEGGYINLNNSSSTPSNTDRRMSQQKQQFVPCTVSIIKNAIYNKLDNSISYQNYQLVNVTVIGYITSVQQTSTLMSYELNDGTSETNLIVKKWIEDKNQDIDRLSFCREDCFVQIIGHLKQQSEDDQRIMMAFCILPITDYNELSYHMVEVIHTHLILPKLQMNENLADHKGALFQNTNINESRNDYGGSPQTGLDSICQQILQMVRRCATSEGIHVLEIQKQMPKYSEKVLREKLEFLHGEGHVYSTISEDHFY